MPGPNDGKAESGAKIFKAKCATCHTCNEGGPNKQGPNLFGVLGRQSGQVSGFKYTEANKNSGIMWSNQVRAAMERYVACSDSYGVQTAQGRWHDAANFGHLPLCRSRTRVCPGYRP